MTYLKPMILIISVLAGPIAASAQTQKGKTDAPVIKKFTKEGLEKRLITQAKSMEFAIPRVEKLPYTITAGEVGAIAVYLEGAIRDLWLVNVPSTGPGPKPPGGLPVYEEVFDDENTLLELKPGKTKDGTKRFDCEIAVISHQSRNLYMVNWDKEFDEVTPLLSELDSQLKEGPFDITSAGIQTITIFFTVDDMLPLISQLRSRFTYLRFGLGEFHGPTIDSLYTALDPVRTFTKPMSYESKEIVILTSKETAWEDIETVRLACSRKRIANPCISLVAMDKDGNLGKVPLYLLTPEDK